MISHHHDHVGVLSCWQQHLWCAACFVLSQDYVWCCFTDSIIYASTGCCAVTVLPQDCVFLKEPGYAETNWHSDLRMAPLDTNDFVTAWIPLRPVQGGDRDSG